MKKRVEQGKLFKRFFASYCLIIVIVLLITLVIFTTTSATMTSYILDSCTGMLKQSAEALDAFFLRLSNTASRMAIDSSLSKGYMNLNEYNAFEGIRYLRRYRSTLQNVYDIFCIIMMKCCILRPVIVPIEFIRDRFIIFLPKVKKYFGAK